MIEPLEKPVIEGNQNLSPRHNRSISRYPLAVQDDCHGPVVDEFESREQEQRELEAGRVGVVDCEALLHTVEPDWLRASPRSDRRRLDRACVAC